MDCVTTGAQIESHSILHACYRYIRAPTHRRGPSAQRRATASPLFARRTRGRERDTRDPTLGDHVGAPAAPRVRTEARANL